MTINHRRSIREFGSPKECNLQTGPVYGTSQHYLDKTGEAYFIAQNVVGEQSALWSLHLWEPYITDQDDILDFGCGNGALLEYLPGHTKAGVEINPMARSRVSLRGLDVYASLDEVRVEGLSFSRIISNHAIEHIPSPYHALQSMRDLLKPGGKLILMLPLDDWRSRSQRYFSPDDMHHHLYAWTPQTLGNLLSEAGFRPERIQVISDCLPPIAIGFSLSLPLTLRSLVGALCSKVLRRRQLMAVACID